jgi:hypothetical protein
VQKYEKQGGKLAFVMNFFLDNSPNSGFFDEQLV